MLAFTKKYSLTLLLALNSALLGVTAAPADAIPVWNEISAPRELEKRQAIPGTNIPFTVPRGSVRALWDNLETEIPTDYISGPLTIETYIQLAELTPPKTVYNNTNIVFSNSAGNIADPALRILHISFRNPLDGITITSRFGNPLTYQGAQTTSFSALEATWETNQYTKERLVRFTIEPVYGTPGSGRRYRFTFAPTRSTTDNQVFTYTVPAGFPAATKASYIHYLDNASPRLSAELHVGYGVPLNA